MAIKVLLYHWSLKVGLPPIIIVFTFCHYTATPKCCSTSNAKTTLRLSTQRILPKSKPAYRNTLADTMQAHGHPPYDHGHEATQLRRDLASTEVHTHPSRGGSIHSYREPHSSSPAPSRFGGSVRSSERSPRRYHRDEKEDIRNHYENSSSTRLSQAALNRLALQHADTGPLPLKAKNLELLTSQQEYIDRNCKHGGSAALLHAARSQSGQRETLPCSTLDAHGNPCTEPFRPHRLDERELYVVEVEEEAYERRSRSARKSEGRGKVSGEEVMMRQRGAADSGRGERHTFYKIG